MPFSVPMSSGRQIMRSPQHSLAPLAFTAIKTRSSRQWTLQRARIAAERKANLNHAVAALTQSWVTAIREAATTGENHTGNCGCRKRRL